MKDIAMWLASLGLAKHASLFAEHDIDLLTVGDLTEERLKDLGVSFKDRRTLLRAIPELDKSVKRASLPLLVPNDTAERRQLTVMFCDMVGSTALATRLDPEDVREVILAYQQACADIVRSYRGFIARYMGDGILVYFGYPGAHEDDAERAVRAGLDIVAAVDNLEPCQAVSTRVRVGIATGTVVVGDLVGEGAAREYAAVGETPNIAARLQGLADPGAVVIAPTTRRLLGSLFNLRDLGPHDLKGYSEPLQIWAVEAVAAVESRFDAMHSSERIGLIGRQQELDLLTQLKDTAWQGKGQIVLISGEAGIGKSYLAAQFAAAIKSEQYTRLRYQCSAYHRNTPLYPFIQQLRLAAGIDPADPPSQQVEKLETVIALATAKVQQVAQLFTALLSIRCEDRYPPLAVSAADQRRQTLAALVDQLEGLANRGPVLLSAEDLQWADATSLELFEVAAERVRDLPILAVITIRPEFEPAWSGLPHVTILRLDRLDPIHVRQIVDQVSGGVELPLEVIDQIVAKTDGVPLFVEEFTKTVVESGCVVDPSGRDLLNGTQLPLVVPSTLRDSLMARIDRLDNVRQVAQVGAVVGRSFPYSMLAAVTGLDDRLLVAALERLVEAQLLQEHGSPPNAVYTFKHALVQDTAYESLLRTRRQILHARIVQTIEADFPELIETECEVLAQHCTRADLLDKAIQYWVMAGRRSLDGSHLREATNHLKAAINLLSSRPDSAETQRLELSCQAMLAQALIGTKGYGALETLDAWRRAQVLAATVGTAEQRFAAKYGLWVGQYAQGNFDAALLLADACLKAAQLEGDNTQLCVAHRMSGIAQFVTGNFVGARDHCIRAVELYDMTVHPKLANRLGHDLLVAATCFKGLALWAIGHPRQARETLDSALGYAERLEHPATSAYAHWHAGVIGMLMLGEEGALRSHADALLGLAHKHRFALWGYVGRIVEGFVRAREGGGSVAVDEIRSGLALAREAGGRANDTVILGLLAEAQTAAGDVEAGLASIAEAEGFASRTRQTFWLSELYRLEAKLRLQLRPRDRAGAEAALRKALAIASEQNAKSWQLRASTELALLLADDERGDEALAQLAKVYGLFDDKISTPDLKRARALLERPGAKRREHPSRRLAGGPNEF